MEHQKTHRLKTTEQLDVRNNNQQSPNQRHLFIQEDLEMVGVGNSRNRAHQTLIKFKTAQKE